MELFTYLFILAYHPVMPSYDYYAHYALLIAIC